MFNKIAVFCAIVTLIVKISIAEYSIPEIKFEAFQPKGFRASIPDIEGTQFFAFHGVINRKINNVEPGDLAGDVKEAKNGFWIYYNPEIELKIGDNISYWTFIQHNSLGYRKQGKTWQVQELSRLEPLEKECQKSITIIDGKSSPCKGKIIFSDYFDGNSVDTNKWTVEHRIPTYSDTDSKFNSYQNIDETRYIKNSKLYLKPILARTEGEIRGILDLTQGCTGKTEVECRYEHRSVFLLPPVKSAKINSKFHFKYGKVDIEAKLPAGDWIFPEMHLLPFTNNGAETDSHRIWIAYSRGNAHYVGNDGDDTGGVLLFAGPVIDNEEPIRSKYLASKISSTPFYEGFHVFTLLWEQHNMKFYVDGQEYGNIKTNQGFSGQSMNIDMRTKNKEELFKEEFCLSLGVGVGGRVDFPDGYMSSGKSKPWKNAERDSIKKFFDSKEEWSQTWSGDNAALQIRSITITAI